MTENPLIKHLEEVAAKAVKEAENRKERIIAQAVEEGTWDPGGIDARSHAVEIRKRREAKDRPVEKLVVEKVVPKPVAKKAAPIKKAPLKP